MHGIAIKEPIGYEFKGELGCIHGRVWKQKVQNHVLTNSDLKVVQNGVKFTRCRLHFPGPALKQYSIKKKKHTDKWKPNTELWTWFSWKVVVQVNPGNIFKKKIVWKKGFPQRRKCSHSRNEHNCDCDLLQTQIVTSGVRPLGKLGRLKSAFA